MSGHLVSASRASLAALVLMQSAGVRAESFEVVKYAPPRGWPVQNLQDGRAYVRPDGNGPVRFVRHDQRRSSFAGRAWRSSRSQRVTTRSSAGASDRSIFTIRKRRPSGETS